MSPLSAPSRPRRPLSALPLSLFVPASMTIPSPVSMPTKRNAPASSSTTTPAHAGSGDKSNPKVRKMSVRERDDGDGCETIKRKRITPRERDVLVKDELGVGKSPARRLFVDARRDGEISGGISDAVLAPLTPSIPSRRLAFTPSLPSPSSSRSAPSSSLASPVDSPPIPGLENGAVLSIHDPGFAIFTDAFDSSSTTFIGVGIGTPKSKRSLNVTAINIVPAVASDAFARIPSSPDTTISAAGPDQDQENIPPAWSPTNTPSKRSGQSTPSKSGSSRSYSTDDEEVYLSGGSGRRTRTTERSKLGQVVYGKDVRDEEEDELTPGRRAEGKSKGKERMTREVNRI